MHHTESQLAKADIEGRSIQCHGAWHHVYNLVLMQLGIVANK